MQGLPVLLRTAGRPVILKGEGPAADAKRRLLERAGARVVDDDAHAHAQLAIVAIDDDAAAEEAIAALKARGILVNAVDRPDACDFTLPAIVERDPLLVAVATGGVSAGLAAAVRQAIEAMLPAGLGDLAHQLHAARDALRQRFPDAGERRRTLGLALAPGGALDPLVVQDGGAVERWLGAADAPADAVEHVRVTSSDPDELTLRAARLLARADRVHLVGGVPAAIADRARADADRLSGPPSAERLPGLTVVLEMAE